jgi:hypothetical protein
MSYSDLYSFCQSLTPHAPRKVIYEKVLALTGANRVRHFKTSLDTSVCRGFYLSARNLNHPFVTQAGGRVVVTARTLNRCWERFVYIKELMHLFDDPDSATDTGAAFDELLGEFTGPGATVTSPQMNAEVGCFWRAIATLCPEETRKSLKSQLQGNQTDYYAIALRLRIPEQYVPRLFDPNYEKIISPLLR